MLENSPPTQSNTCNIIIGKTSNKLSGSPTQITRHGGTDCYTIKRNVIGL